jgi:hypothetical protein
MNIKDEANQLRTLILKAVSKAANEGNSEAVSTNSKLLEEVDEIFRVYDSVESRLDAAKERFVSLGPDGCLPSSEDKARIRVSAKALGKQRRDQFVEKARGKGVHLTPVKGVKFTSPQNRLIGIASASESISNKWFLGLPPADYDLVVFLCEDSDGVVWSFIPSNDFILQWLPLLTRDETSQIKFNIRKEGTSFSLLIPGQDRVSLRTALDKFENL